MMASVLSSHGTTTEVCDWSTTKLLTSYAPPTFGHKTRGYEKFGLNATTGVSCFSAFGEVGYVRVCFRLSIN